MGKETMNKTSREELKLVTVTAGRSGNRLEFKLRGLPATDFCEFVEKSEKQDVIKIFREIVEYLEVQRKIMDFHLKIHEVGPSFIVEVFYGDKRDGPQEVDSGDCISCNPDAPLYPEAQPVITARECVLPQFSDQPYVQCHLDAKARPGFIVTPTRHIERLSEMDDEELFALWSVAVKAVREDSISYRNMIVNQGTYRNLPHLHMKIWVTEEEHLKTQQQWSNEKKEWWKQLQTLATRSKKKRKAECVFFQRNRHCRNGANCDFQHSIN